MTKRFLAALLSLSLVFCVFGTTASAADVTEPSGAVHKMSDIKSAFKAGEEYLIQPGDTVELDGTASQILIVDYLTNYKDGSKSVSDGGYDFFRDNNKTTGYAVKAIGDETIYADNVDNTGREIDFSNPYSYEFKGWKVTYAYSESNFNQINLTATWEIPVLEGWEGFLVMIRSYLRTFIDYLFAYIVDLSKRMVDYFG